MRFENYIEDTIYGPILTEKGYKAKVGLYIVLLIALICAVIWRIFS